MLGSAILDNRFSRATSKLRRHSPPCKEPGSKTGGRLSKPQESNRSDPERIGEKFLPLLTSAKGNEETGPSHHCGRRPCRSGLGSRPWAAGNIVRPRGAPP